MKERALRIIEGWVQLLSNFTDITWGGKMMAINLQKGQTIDLTKDRAGLEKITVGLSWGKAVSVAPEQKESKGLLARLFDKAAGEVERRVTSVDMDIDASVILLNSEGRVVETIYYGNKRDSSGSIIHAGDDRSGNDKYGQYDNEEIAIDLSRIPSGVAKLVFVANVYRGETTNQHFGQVKGSYIRVLEAQGREELIRYDLADEYDGMRGIVVGELYRHNNEWKFRALGQATQKDDLGYLRQMVSR